jgi:hypothetical protein
MSSNGYCTNQSVGQIAHNQQVGASWEGGGLRGPVTKGELTKYAQQKPKKNRTFHMNRKTNLIHVQKSELRNKIDALCPGWQVLANCHAPSWCDI